MRTSMALVAVPLDTTLYISYADFFTDLQYTTALTASIPPHQTDVPLISAPLDTLAPVLCAGYITLFRMDIQRPPCVPVSPPMPFLEHVTTHTNHVTVLFYHYAFVGELAFLDHHTAVMTTAITGLTRLRTLGYTICAFAPMLAPLLLDAFYHSYTRAFPRNMAGAWTVFAAARFVYIVFGILPTRPIPFFALSGAALLLHDPPLLPASVLPPVYTLAALAHAVVVPIDATLRLLPFKTWLAMFPALLYPFHVLITRVPDHLPLLTRVVMYVIAPRTRHRALAALNTTRRDGPAR